MKLHGMAFNYPEVAAQARHTDFTPEVFLTQLLKAETAERAVRSIAYQMGAARFPAHRDLAGFEFAQANVDEALVSKQFEVHPTQITEWKRQLLEHAADAFGGGAERVEPVDLAPLRAKIGQLTLENDFLEGVLTKAGLLSAKR